MKQFINKFLFLVTKRALWVEIVGIIVFVLAVLFWLYKTNDNAFDCGNFKSWWGKWLDPFTGLSTFLVALIIWVLNRAKDWEDRLPKLLTVTYKLDGRDVIICKNATLAHEGDIRNWGQQLGQQTIGRSIRFKLLQKFDTGIPTIHEPTQKGTKYHKHYTATFYLKDNSGVKELDIGSFQFDANDPGNDSKTTNYVGPVIEEKVIAEKPNRIEFTVDLREKFGVLKFNLADSITPKDLRDLIPDNAKNELFSGKGIILSGKGPIWLYGYLVHYYHATQWVATYDPRLDGAVVVESHVTDVSVGDIIKLD